MRKAIWFIIGFWIVFSWFLVTGAQAADVNLKWDANSESDLAGYRIYQSQTSGAYGAFSAEILAGTETVTLTDIPDGTYFWVLTAYDTNNNESGYSNEVTATLDGTAPGAPLNFTIAQ